MYHSQIKKKHIIFYYTSAHNPQHLTINSKFLALLYVLSLSNPNTFSTFSLTNNSFHIHSTTDGSISYFDDAIIIVLIDLICQTMSYANVLGLNKMCQSFRSSMIKAKQTNIINSLFTKNEIEFQNIK
jgi:hypothetical protein